MAKPDVPTGRDTDLPQTLEVAEEVALVRTQRVDNGGIRLETFTDTITEMIPVELHRDEIEVRHVPVDRVVESAPPIREEDGVTIIPILRERAVMRTELVLVEELHVIRHDRVETVEMPVELRKQHVVETPLNSEDIRGDQDNDK